MKLDVVADERVGQGGYLHLRRLRLRGVRGDGSKAEGLWDYVERPMGLDAVVLALWRRREGRVEVLLRSGVRVPLLFGRPGEPARALFPELVAGILEPGDDVGERAAAEAREEAGLAVNAAEVRRLGPPMFPTPGMCAEQFHFVHAEVPGDAAAAQPAGDGSIFEEGASLEWVELEQALTRCTQGAIEDLKTEIGLRRLRETIGR